MYRGNEQLGSSMQPLRRNSPLKSAENKLSAKAGEGRRVMQLLDHCSCWRQAFKSDVHSVDPGSFY